MADSVTRWAYKDPAYAADYPGWKGEPKGQMKVLTPCPSCVEGRHEWCQGVVTCVGWDWMGRAIHGRDCACADGTTDLSDGHALR